ncbi:MAG: M14 family metallopeptidase [Ignavibacteriaceae bacterium]|nr:M14 family metallopeptidase [Ignavibacteriaceae bacterium]
MKNLFAHTLILLSFLPFVLQAQPRLSKEWETLFEKSSFLSSPSYSETMDYFKRLENHSPLARMISIGKSPQGRDIYSIIVSKEKYFTPIEAKKSGKPIILITCGIHSGEIEGKDAGMLLLREILVTKEKENYLDNAILLFVPIFSVDGHERSSRYNRINQNGPTEMGWRTTAQNLNLNRDWVKADAPEMQALLKFFNEWLPDFFIDSHTTNGADYQYTITYGIEKFRTLYGGLSKEVTTSFIPYMEKRMNESGFLIAPYVGFKDGVLEKGIVDWASPPRFSNGYAAYQNRMGLLVETHMLKPFKERVFSTKAMFEIVLEYVNKNASKLVALNKEADEMSIKNFTVDKEFFPISLKGTDESEPFIFKGIKFIKDSSEISGTTRITYTDEPFDLEIPFYNKTQVIDSVRVPKKYIIPKEWGLIVDRLKLHGVKVEKFNNSEEIKVTRYKFKDVKFQQNPYEGRHLVNADYDSFSETIRVNQGDYFVSTNQRAIRIITTALEPKSSDSFLRWGFMNSIFERKEYFEGYVMEKLAPKMIEENPELKIEFEKKLETDEQFRKNPYARLSFFYERSPYYDKNLNLYPIMIVEND